MAGQKKEELDSYVKQTASLSEANNHLALKLHKLLSKVQENVFFSPFSISTALAMLHHGARNETANEMKKVLGYEKANMSNDVVTSSYRHLLQYLSVGSTAYTLAVANSLLTQVTFSVHDQYKADLQEVYRALVKEVDFQSNSQAAVAEINEYVKENTKNMIPKLLDSLDPATVIVILNAVYFKGTWVDQFEHKSTYQRKFFNKGLESNAKEVSTMFINKSFFFVENKSFKALELPYKGDIAMMLLLPNARDGLRDLENGLGDDFLKEVKKSMFRRKVEVSLPKFRMEYSKSLKETFQDMGMDKVFRRGAELHGLSDSSDLAVSAIIHKAVLEVNEEGSEAAAATAVSIMLCSMPLPSPEFIADHPFMFLIYDTRNELILFMGKVEEL